MPILALAITLLTATCATRTCGMTPRLGAAPAPIHGEPGPPQEFSGPAPSLIPITADEAAPREPKLTAHQASIRIQEVLVAAGWQGHAHEVRIDLLELDSDDWRAHRTWRYMPESQFHVLLDADSGALLYLDAFHFNDESQWHSLPREPGQPGDYIFPGAPPVSIASAMAIAESMLTSQYSVFHPRSFALDSFRPLEKWPLWDLNYTEQVQEQRFPNEFGVLIDWNTGRILEFCATNLQAPYEIKIDQATAERLAIRHWEDMRASQGCTGVIVGTTVSSHVDLVALRAHLVWTISLELTCWKPGSLFRGGRDVDIDAFSGKVTGWNSCFD